MSTTTISNKDKNENNIISVEDYANMDEGMNDVFVNDDTKDDDEMNYDDDVVVGTTTDEEENQQQFESNEYNNNYEDDDDDDNNDIDDNDEEEDIDEGDDKDLTMEIVDRFHLAMNRNKSINYILKFLKRYPIVVQQTDKNGNYPLHIVCRWIQYNIVILKLIELYPIAVQHHNRKGVYPFHIACTSSQDDNVIMKLIHIFPNIATIESNRYGYAINTACSHTISELIIRKLVEIYPVALQRQCPGGSYPIYRAFIAGQSDEVMKFLIDTDPLAIRRQEKDSDETLLYMACLKDRFHLVEYILQHTTDVQVNARTRNSGMTPLHAACCYCHSTSPIVETLLQIQDIDVNAKDINGMTPLYMAASCRNLNAVQKLLNHPFILINEKRNNSNGTLLDSIKFKIKRLEDLEEEGYDTENKIPEYVEIVKVLEEFPIKRRWDMFTYYLLNI